MHELGVAPEPIHQRHLSPGGLADAITHAVTDASMAAAAARSRERVCAEDGVHDAVRQLEAILGAE
jgi:sterol 3beta-glucosyltransferase